MIGSLELFSCIDELEQFDIDEYCYKIQPKFEDLRAKFALRNNFIQFNINNDYTNKRDQMYSQIYYEDYWLSFLYTANYLKWAHLSIKTVDLAYSFKIDNIQSPTEISWINSFNPPQDNLFKNNHKRTLYNGEQSKWKKMFETQSIKPYFNKLIQYNQESATIPYFLYELTYLVLFTCSQEIGISGTTIKMDKYSSFYNNLIDTINLYITDDNKKLLILYKAENFFHPWLINSYRALLETQYKQTYYSHIDWSQILNLYHFALPCQMCDFVINLLCLALLVDYHINISSETEQLDFFAENFNKELTLLKDFSEIILDFKKAMFYDLYKSSKNLDDVINTCSEKLKEFPKTAYTRSNFKNMKEQTFLHINELYSKIKSPTQQHFLRDIPHGETVKDKDLRISTKVYKDCSILFK